uniref:Uncharacterized protein n=1 Tax=Meloidogyne javanica TaxID=6303 RepID=A0A915LHC5_MELJA
MAVDAFFAHVLDQEIVGEGLKLNDHIIGGRYRDTTKGEDLTGGKEDTCITKNAYGIEISSNNNLKQLESIYDKDEKPLTIERYKRYIGDGAGEPGGDSGGGCGGGGGPCGCGGCPSSFFVRPRRPPGEDQLYTRRRPIITRKYKPPRRHPGKIRRHCLKQLKSTYNDKNEQKLAMKRIQDRNRNKRYLDSGIGDGYREGAGGCSFPFCDKGFCPYECKCLPCLRYRPKTYWQKSYQTKTVLEDLGKEHKERR